MTRVLIVDDNPMDRRVAGAYVEQAGMKVDYAEDGNSALRRIAADPPDIVLTDLNMPDLNGLQLVREVQRRNPTLPVILMTARGSEDVAVTALQEGASSYVPKRKFDQDLINALRIVGNSSRSLKNRQKVYEYLQQTESRFVIGNDHDATSVLVSYFLDAMRLMNLCSEGELLRAGTALTEAVVNAIDHGNLELNSQLRDTESGDEYHELARKRLHQEPYCSRRVFVSCHLTESEAAFSIRDEGPGFDPSTLPDPGDPENVMRAHGRGLMLIRTFMDQVSFNETGNEIRMSKRSQQKATA